MPLHTEDVEEDEEDDTEKNQTFARRSNLSTFVLYMATYMKLVDLRIELAVPKKLMVLTQACESIFACDDLLPSCNQSLHQFAGPAKECPCRFGYSQESVGQRESELSDTCSCLWEV